MGPASLVPGSDLANILIIALVAYDPQQAIEAMRAASYLPIEILMTAIGGAWLDVLVADELLHGGAVTIDDHRAIASSPECVAGLQPLGGHPLDVFDLLAVDDAGMTAALAANPDLSAWMKADPARLEAHLGAAADKALWAAWLVALPDIPLLIKLAKADGTWGAAVDANNLFDPVIAAAPAAGDQDTFDGLYALLGDATARTRAQNDAAYAKIIQVRLLTSGQMLDLVYRVKTHNQTVGGVAMTWSITKTPVPIDPSDSAMGLYLNTMKTVPRSAILATNTLIFAAEEEYYWWQTAPAANASTTWHPWSTPKLKRLGTSYAGAGVVTIKAHKAGDKVQETVRAADGSVSRTGVELTMNDGDVSSTDIGADWNTGSGTATGGGEDRTAAGGMTTSRCRAG